MVTNDLLVVKARLEREGIPLELVEDRLEIPCGADTLYVRVMRDPGHPDRVHLRSLTPAGEVTVSTQRMNAVKKLVDYVKVLRAAADRRT